MGGIGWMVEDHLVEVVNLWRRHLARELPGLADPALGYAAPVFLRELARALRDDPAAANPFRRCELLLKVAPSEGPAGVVHEFRLLRRALWEVLRAHGRLVSPQERTVADEKIDEAIAAAIGRLLERPMEREARTRVGAKPEGRSRTARGEDGAPEPTMSARTRMALLAAAKPTVTAGRFEAPRRSTGPAGPAAPRPATIAPPNRAAAATPPPLPMAADAMPEP